MKRIRYALFILIILLFVTMFFPFGEKIVVFKSVLPIENLEIEEMVISSKRDNIPIDRDFVIHQDKLYLRFQVTQSFGLIFTQTQNTNWNSERIEKLAQTYPELNKYWYTPSRKVDWIE